MSGVISTIVCVHDADLSGYCTIQTLRQTDLRVVQVPWSGSVLDVVQHNPSLIVLDLRPDTMFFACRELLANRAVSPAPILSLLEPQEQMPASDGASELTSVSLTRPVHPVALRATVKFLIDCVAKNEAGTEIENLRSVDATAAASPELQAYRQVERLAEVEAELQTLLQEMSHAPASVTARLYGSVPLRESLPEVFQDLVQQMQRLLDVALEQRAMKVEHDVSSRLKTLAERLGFLSAVPRDVIAIYSLALERQSSNRREARAKAYVDEGRLLVLELMGHLASYYRSRYAGRVAISSHGMANDQP